MHTPSMGKFGLLLLLLLLLFLLEQGWSQCAGVASTPRAASDCATHAIPAGKIAALDPTHLYSLAELVDIAEHNNHGTRVVWERAAGEGGTTRHRQKYLFPCLDGYCDIRGIKSTIEPFPQPLAPRGYIMVEATVGSKAGNCAAISCLRLWQERSQHRRGESRGTGSGS